MVKTCINAKAQLHNRPIAIAAVVAACRAVRRQADSSAQALAGASDGRSVVALSQGLDPSEPFEVEFISAFSEIFNNIVLHSYSGGSDADVMIEMRASADRLVVRITDGGIPFDPKSAAEPDLAMLPEGGMGIFIARAFLDEVRYEPGPPNHWILEKCYRSSDAASRRSDNSSSPNGSVDS